MTTQLEWSRETPPADPQGSGPGDELSIAFLLAAILRNRRRILRYVIAGLVVGVLLALTKRTMFTSSFSFIAETPDDERTSGLASLAGQFGISLGGSSFGSSPPQLYADLLSTNQILSSIAHDTVSVEEDGTRKRVLLPALLRVKATDSAQLIEKTVRSLRTKVINATVAARTTGAVTVTVTTRSPAASLEIAQHLFRALNDFNREARQTQATAERRFAEERLGKIRKTEIAVEDSLQRFLQANREFAVSSQLRFEQERLESNVSLQRDLVRELSQQAEEARIREVRDTPVITLIDPPTLPVFRDATGRVATLVVCLLGGLMLGIAVVVARAGWDQRRSNSTDGSYATLSEEWRRVAGRFARSRR